MNRRGDEAGASRAGGRSAKADFCPASKDGHGWIYRARLGASLWVSRMGAVGQCGVAMLPLLLCVSGLCRLARRLIDSA